MSNKKYSASMQFLEYYGWAILVGIVAIGVLAYSSIFNPNSLVSHVNSSEKELCEKHNLTYDPELRHACIDIKGDAILYQPIRYYNNTPYLDVSDHRY